MQSVSAGTKVKAIDEKVVTGAFRSEVGEYTDPGRLYASGARHAQICSLHPAIGRRAQCAIFRIELQDPKLHAWDAGCRDIPSGDKRSIGQEADCGLGICSSRGASLTQVPKRVGGVVTDHGLRLARQKERRNWLPSGLAVGFVHGRLESKRSKAAVSHPREHSHGCWAYMDFAEVALHYEAPPLVGKAVA